MGRTARKAQARSALDIPPLWHDGTERPIQRPQDPEEQEEYDRGQKKRHTRNNLLVINACCHIGCLSPPCAGKASAISVAEMAGDPLPLGRCLDQEKGFQGFFLPGVTMVQSKKKPHGGDLTPLERAANRQISSMRIRIEHAMGRLKRDRIVKDIIRLLKDGMRDAVMETCCGLPNFRLLYRPWNYAH